MKPVQTVADTCAQMIREKIPNFFRLYLNPFVVQTCYCLNQYVQSTWPKADAPAGYQTFLGNSFDEALSGAMKLARYSVNARGGSPRGLVFGPEDRLGPFAALPMADGGKLEFVPDLTVVGLDGRVPEKGGPGGARCGFVVVILSAAPAAMAGWKKMATTRTVAAPGGAVPSTSASR